MHNCDIHTHNNPRPGVPSVVDVSGRGDFVFGQEMMFSVGIHPKYITDDWEGALIEVAKAAANSNCVAIGECGLDKFADAPLTLQEKVFESQIVLARDFAKPLIIHCVRLYSYVIHLFRKRSFKNPVVFHGYNGNPDITAQLLKLPNAYFSFSESTFATPETSGSKSLPLIPVSRILTETDCNAATDINVTIKKIADKKQMDASSLQQSIYENFMRVIGGAQEH
ncbi:MAG: TatD family hydrolase [Bacteroidales bacterium]|nr:TatD family hydrolase [Bacteroidales bacterium]